MAKRKRGSGRKSRPTGTPARRWHRNANIDLPEPEEAPELHEEFHQPQPDPLYVVAVAEKLVRQLVRGHEELQGPEHPADELTARPGLWGCRIFYAEEVSTNDDGSPVWSSASEHPKVYNVPLSSRGKMLDSVYSVVTVGMKGLPGMTKRRLVLGLTVYVYPDRTAWSPRDPRSHPFKKVFRKRPRKR